MDAGKLDCLSRYIMQHRYLNTFHTIRSALENKLRTFSLLWSYIDF